MPTARSEERSQELKAAGEQKSPEGALDEEEREETLRQIRSFAGSGRTMAEKERRKQEAAALFHKYNAGEMTVAQDGRG